MSTRKNIAIDCFKLVKGEGASIGIYNFTKNFVENLAPLGKYNIYIFGNKFNKNDFDIKGVNFIEIPIKIRNKFIYVLWEIFLVNKYIYKYDIELTIYPRGYIPLFSLSKTFNIVHDLIPLYYYENHREQIDYLENFYIRNRLLSSIKKSDKTITISNYSKKDILKYLELNYDHISVIYNGYNRLEKASYIESSEKYIVSVSSDRFKHKNLINIIKTYVIYHDKVDNPMKLYLIGVKTLDNLNIRIQNTVLNDIILFDFVSDKKYVEVVQNARIFLFLSLIEGFGFPPLEAMNLGVPVICSNKTSLEEVVSDGGELVDPNDIDYIVDRIINIDRDEQYRKKLIDNGYKNIERFQWCNLIKQYSDEITKQLE